MTKLIRMGMIAIAGIMVAGGLGFMFFPVLMETDFGVVASRLDGMGTLRADLGGTFLALAVFTFMGSQKGREDWILVPAVFMGLFLVGRGAHMAIDGISDFAIRSTVVELALLAIFLLAWKRLKREAGAGIT